MKIPINWLENYIKLEHKPKEFGDIMTKLEFMQDGPIEEVNGEPVIDLEVRQNRPDVLSILGAVREYAAYINKPVQYPEKLDEFPVKIGKPKNLLKIDAVDIVKRFTAVVIKNVEIKESSLEIQKYLKAYGIPTINNIVDITNFVMLEYGIPMHAFDLDKLKSSNNLENADLRPLLNLRMAESGEEFTTWQGTEVKLTSEDLVVTDSQDRVVSIAGITGEKESGISKNTQNILLEAANYNHASIRRTSMKHNVFTDSGLRHSKILPSDMVEEAIKRGAFLIQNEAGGEITKGEDYYDPKQDETVIEFNIKNIERLGGKEIPKEKTVELLERLSFKVEDKGNDSLQVTAPKWRTDITHQEDLVEEVWRLYGYEKIPTQEITAAPPKNITPDILTLEEKTRDILLNLKLNEQITEPLVKFKNKKNQIELENPLNKDKNGLRVSLKETLKPIIETYKKAGKEKVRLFEIGKVYYKKGNDFIEEKRAAALYENEEPLKIKGDLQAVLNKLGILNYNIEKKKKNLIYKVKDKTIAKLENNGFELYTKVLVSLVELREVPKVSFRTSLYQEITEDITFSVSSNINLEKLKQIIKNTSKYITKVFVEDPEKDIFKKGEKTKITLTIKFEDAKNTLTREKVNNIKKDFIKKSEKEIGARVPK